MPNWNSFKDYKQNTNTVTDSFGAQAQIYQGNNWLNKKDIFGSGAGSNLGTIVGVVDQGVDTALNLVGKQADDISGGEQVYSKLTSGALNMALKTGNPYLMAGAGVLKGLDYLNRYAGKTTDKQGTIGIDTGAYTNLINSKANRKQTLLFSGKNRMNKLNSLTQSYDRQNLLAANANYAEQQNSLAAVNTAQDIASKNQQALFGGVNTRMLVAKKGAKINPAQLRNLVKKAQRGTKLQKISFEDWYNTVPKDRNDTTSYNLRRAYELAPRKELERWRTATPEQLKDTTYHLKTFYWNDAGIGEFVKSKNHPTVKEEINFYNSDKAKDFRAKYKLFDDGSDYYQYVPIGKFQEGGKMNVIPEGALHARKHNLPEAIAEKVTNKGIPVITLEEGGDIKQHAEIEVNEIIFNKETTDKLEDFFKKFNEAEDKKDKDLIAIEAGKFLASEILENTEDNTNLIKTIE